MPGTKGSMEHTPGKKYRQLFFSAVFLAASAFVMTLCLLNSQNNLLRNGHWENAKMYLQLPVHNPFVTNWSRATLANNRLHLDFWHGFQMFYTKSTAIPAAVQFSADVSAEGSIDLIFNYRSDTGAGIRIGKDQVFAYSFDREWRFTNKIPLPGAEVSVGGNNRIELEEQPRGLRLGINGDFVFVPGFHFSEGATGFRGGSQYEPVAVDDVFIRYKNGSFYADDFRHKENEQGFLAKNIALFFLGALAMAGIFYAGGFYSLFYLSFAHVSRAAIVFSLFWYLFDSLYLWKLPMTNFVISSDSPTWAGERLEFARQKIFWRWYSLLGGQGVEVTKSDFSRLRAPFYCPPDGGRCMEGVAGVPPKEPGEFRLVLVGGSFFEGAGATALDDAFFARLHRRLPQKMPEGFRLSIVNLATSQIFEEKDIERRVREFSPSLILYELRTDTHTKSTLLAALRGLRRIRAPYLCISRYVPKKGELPKLRYVAQAFEQEPCENFDYGEFLGDLSQREEGFVFWDRVHLTSFGHDKFARWLADKLLPILKNMHHHGGEPGTAHSRLEM